ncbi:MAG TPA: hypothetical protein VGR36_08740 [Candidatus Acidoferrales bacterium]|nr:hypothetical protein [Candidatus Acidoferrales bacterium]
MPESPAGKTTVFGVYANYSDMERGIGQLQAAGFRGDDISVLLPEGAGPAPIPQSKRNRAEGAAAGGVSGAVVGGALGWLAGIGVLVIPGFGLLLAAGPLLATLAGVGVGGAVAGVAGALIGTGIPENEAAKYESRLKTGAILISVYTDGAELAERAHNILVSTGAEEITAASRRAARSAQ